MSLRKAGMSGEPRKVDGEGGRSLCQAERIAKAQLDDGFKGKEGVAYDEATRALEISTLALIQQDLRGL